MGKIDAAVRQADVVEDRNKLVRRDNVADPVFDEIGEACGLLDAGARLGPQVKDELTAIGIGKEVLAEPWRQAENRKYATEENSDEDFAVMHERDQKIAIAQP